jgi:U3 small nucleolar RNA-associated protein 3
VWTPLYYYDGKSVGATKQGQQYLLTKAMLQKSIALNSIMYLLVRSTTSGGDDGITEIQSHPVMAQLKTLNSMLQKLENQVEKNVDGIEKQLEYLVKAAALMGDGDDGGDDDSSDDSISSEQRRAEGSNDLIGRNSENRNTQDNEYDEDKEETEADEERKATAQKQQMNFQNTLNEARFGFRPSEVTKKRTDKRKRIDDSYADDFGDLDDNEMPSLSSKALASTINAIEQRSNTATRKRRPVPVAEELDALDEETDDRLAEGIKMMEEEMGKLDEGSDDDIDLRQNSKVQSFNPDDDEMDEFYKSAATKSKAKKSIKKGLYAVAPKFPRKDYEIDGERAISRAILKNRGLVAHKAKINRNPRVKKREQYRKAQIRRKGAVREVRKDEGHRYGGEGTGIKSGISRSRKLTSK